MLSGIEPTPRAEAPSRTGNPYFYEVFGKRYQVNNSNRGFRQRGIASWYGEEFQGKKTSSGELYDMYTISAAHKTLPIPSYARVTRLDNGQSIVVKINDRGPFVGDRIIDLSYAAATKLGIVGGGTAAVEVAAVPPYQDLARSEPAPEPEPAAPLWASRSAVPARAELPPVKLVSAVYLQLGAFSNRASAEHLRQRLAQRLGYSVQIDSSSGALHKVRVGPLKNPADAEQIELQLAHLGINDLHRVYE